jgi:ribonuclease Z
MFTASLINDCFEDPGVYVEFRYRREALLFDLGDLHNLTPRKILKISHIFVSHTHMDHFIGFDRLLRICLGRDQHISLFGPPGFISNIESKIGAYTWNLVENYTNDFILLATEIHEHHLITNRYHCQTGFKPEVVSKTDRYVGNVIIRNDFTVRGVFLDHRIPSMAYALEEKHHINVKKNALEDMNLPVGPWLGELKESILREDPDDQPIEVWRRENNEKVIEAVLPLGELREEIIIITPGIKISYVADAIYSEENARKIIELAEESDILFIEAPFLEKDADVAYRKYHLTAKQAGDLARKAGAKNFSIFHFSPKYKGSEDLLFHEAMTAFRG